MYNINKKTALWAYMPEDIKSLIEDGEILLKDASVRKTLNHGHVSDFSYLVFPFSKAYEGFLKRLFLDIGLIREDEYYGDDIRIGRILNPHYIHEKENVFDRLCKSRSKGGKSVKNEAGNGVKTATQLWTVWKKGRNQVFHYFPHNFRRLSYDEALDIVKDIMLAMELAISGCVIPTKKETVESLI